MKPFCVCFFPNNLESFSISESWDNENKCKPHDKVLDLCTNSDKQDKPAVEPLKDRAGMNQSPPKNFTPDNTFLKRDDMKLPPMELYQQYYYYLIREPTFTSRAAAVVAEAYAKLMTTDNHQHLHHLDSKLSPHHEKLEKSISPDGSPFFEVTRTSPDFIINGNKTELCSADTTNMGLTFDRKRISRPLTGKHVRHGTGASPSTLVTLRHMIQQRQKLKENNKFIKSNLNRKDRGNKRIKRK